MRKLPWLLLIIISASCSQLRIKKELDQFYSTKIQDPSNLISIQNGIVLGNTTNENDCLTRLLIYFSSKGCTPCKVSHISDFDTLYNMQFGADRFVPQIIINPLSEQFDDIVNQIKFQKHSYSVYIDKKGEFEQLNACLPEDIRYHTFLIDKNNRVVLVGNPLANDKMWSLFKSTLDNMLAHDGVYVPEK